MPDVSQADTSTLTNIRNIGIDLIVKRMVFAFRLQRCL
jgi:hypothetical protein